MNDGLVRRSWLLVLLAGLMTGGQPLRADEVRMDPQALSIGDAKRALRSVSVAVDRIVDTQVSAPEDATLELAALAHALKPIRVLFVGEEHTNLEFHRVQLEVIRALHHAGRRVTIGLEMFSWDYPSALARWSRGELDEESFLTESRWYETWSHSYGYYREIFDYARQHALPLIGLNAPRAVVRDIRRTRSFDDLPPNIREYFPPSIDTQNGEHRQLVASYFDPEDRLHAALPEVEREGIYFAQLAWDAAMGWQASRALSLQQDATEILVVLAGSGHVAYDLGAARHIADTYRQHAASLIPVVVGAEEATASAAYARFLWGIPVTPQPGLPTLGISLMGAIGKEPTQVIQVDAQGVAAKAGIRVGDILRSIDGSPLPDMAALQRKMGAYRWGDQLTVNLERSGLLSTLLVTLQRP